MYRCNEVRPYFWKMDKHYSIDGLHEFTRKVFLQIGCSVEHAEQATEALLSADIRGIDSHGIARLSGYVRLWEAKRIEAKPDIKIVHETPSTATVDGGKGLGLVVAPVAMQIAIRNSLLCG